MSAFELFVLAVWLLGCFQAGRLAVGAVVAILRLFGWEE